MQITNTTRRTPVYKRIMMGIINHSLVFRLSLALLLPVCFIGSIGAQSTLTIGTGTATSNTYGPIYRTANNSTNDFLRAAYYYPTVDLTSIPIGATITQLEWNLTTTTSIIGTGDAPFTVYLKNSTATGNTQQPWATILADATQVLTRTYNSTNNLPPVGWVPFSLANPYIYTGDALFVAVDWNIYNVTNNPTSGSLAWQVTTGLPAAYTRFEMTTTSAPTNLTYTRTERPNIRITYTDPAVFAPASLTATPYSSERIDLAWSQNALGESVMIVANTTNTFGTPTDGTAYTVGNTLLGGGTVIYRGPAASFNHTGLAAATTYYYKAYSYTGADGYSYPKAAGATTYCQTFNGTYTVGSGGNFGNFNAVTAALACGNVVGPVIFNVLPGTYNESVILTEVAGVSAVNTITFQSSTGNNSDVLLQQSASSDVLRIDGGDYFIIKNISITSANGNAAHPIRLENAANYNVIEGCRLEKNATTSANINYSIIRHSETAAAEFSEYNSFINNTLIGGAYGINYNFGSALGSGITIQGNTFQNQYANGIVLTYQNAPTVVSGNIITSNSAYSTGFVGISITNSQGAFSITGNKVYGTGNIKGGIEVGSAGNALAYALVANNMITAGSTTNTQGIYFTSTSNYVNVYYNTVLVTAGNTTTSQGAFYSLASGTAYFDVRNNIFANIGGGVANYAVNFANALTNTVVNHNNYRVSGTNLGRRGTSVATCLSGCGTASWTNLTSQDGSSINIDPLFVSNTDLHVGASALAAGIHLPSVTTDIDGDPRPTTNPYIGADEAVTVITDDAGITAVVSPTGPVCAGSNAITVEVFNYGSDPLTSVTVNWTLNGVPQTPVTQTGFSIPNGASTTVTLGPVNLATGSTNTLTYATSSPNGVADGNTSNDSLNSSTILVSLNGTYTIGGTSPDFATFNDAVSALTDHGICGPITFNVRQGTYTEQVLIGSIIGASAVNTITFQPDAANTNPVILEHNSQALNQNYVLGLNGSGFLRFKNLTIRSSNTGTYRRIVSFSGSNNNVRFEGNTLQGPTSNSNNTNYTIVYMDGANGEADSNIVFHNNQILNGSYGLYIQGALNSYENNNEVTNNTITGYYADGITLRYQNGVKVEDNVLANGVASSTSATGLYVYFATGTISIQRNKVETVVTGSSAGSVGLELSNLGGTSSNHAIVANNFVAVNGRNGSVYGIFITGPTGSTSNYVDLVFNNVYVSGTSTSNSRSLYINGGSNFRVLNNNVVTLGSGFAIYSSSSATLASCNYNNFYYNATGLFGYRTGNYATIANWRSATGHDLNSLTVDPQYVSTTSPFDLHVSNSDLAGAGIAVAGITTDIDGDTRPNPPSIGADEVAPPVTNTVWTGNVSNDWFTAGNWTGGVPTATLDAVIANVSATSNRYPILISIAGSYGEAKDLTIDAGASITLPTGTSIRVSGNLTNNGSTNFGAGTLRFTNAGSHTIDGNLNVGIVTIEANTTLNGTANIGEALNLVAGVLNTTNGILTLKSDATTTAYINDFGGNTGSITGNVTVERYVANTINGFHYIGSPVGGTNIADWGNEFSTTGPNNAFVIPQPTCDPSALATGSPYGGLFDYVESNVTNCYLSGWRVRSSGNLGNTEGYAGIIPDGTVINVTGTANTGIINSGALTRTTANTTSTQGMHLVSNPYPSPIDWFEVRAINSDIDGTAYLWLSNGGYQGTYQPVNAIAPGSSLIGSSQGFFVEALSNGAVLNYTNDTRVAANTSFFRSGPAYENRLILNVSGNGYNDRTVVAFASNFTHGYDNDFDSKKMLSKNGVMTIYTSTNTAYPRQATNALPNDRSVKIVPVGFLPGTDGTFTFTADDLATFPNGSLIYLEDKQLGTFTNLLQQNSYTFGSLATDAEDRFVLHFVPNVVVTKQDADCDNLGSVSVDLGVFDLNTTTIVWDNLTLTDNGGNIVWAANQVNGLQTQTLPVGTYTLTLEIDGYTVTSAVVVGGLSTIAADAVASDTAVLEGDAITFANHSSGATGYAWDFGDGNTSTNANPTHVYTTAGTYTVTLTASNNDCSATFTQVIVVDKEQGTGLLDSEASNITIYGNGNKVVIKLVNVQHQLEVDIVDIAGRKLIETKTLAPSQIDYNLNLSPIASGYYFVRVQSGNISKVKKVFLHD